jgi:hypothetical protein
MNVGTDQILAVHHYAGKYKTGRTMNVGKNKMVEW